jgi:hypothetical protein
MVLILVLLMGLGCGGLWSAPGQAEIPAAIVCTESLPGCLAFIPSRNAETNPIPPHWSG